MELRLWCDESYEAVKTLVFNLVLVQIEEFHENRVLSVFKQIEITVIVEHACNSLCSQFMNKARLKSQMNSSWELFIFGLLFYKLKMLLWNEIIISLRSISVQHHFVNPHICKSCFFVNRGIFYLLCSFLFLFFFVIFFIWKLAVVNFFHFQNMAKRNTSHVPVVSRFMVVWEELSPFIICKPILNIKLELYIVFVFIITGTFFKDLS